MSDLSFGRPDLWPWLLLAVPAWFAVWWLLRARKGAPLAYGAILTERVPAPASRACRVVFAIVFLLLAFMEPRYGEEQIQIERRGLDIIFALDTSRSMLARDMDPDRLSASKRDIRAVLPDLEGGDRVGLVAFAGVARLIVPLTHDLDTFRQLLEPVDTDAVWERSDHADEAWAGTDLAAAIRKSLELVDDGHQSTAVIVLITDGEDRTGAAKQAAREARDRGVVVHAVAYGSTAGSKIALSSGGKEKFLAEDGVEVISSMQSDQMRELVGITGGAFLHSRVMALPLRQLKEKRLDPMVKRAYEAGQETVYKTRFQWALIPAMLLLMLELLFVGGARR